MVDASGNSLILGFNDKRTVGIRRFMVRISFISSGAVGALQWRRLFTIFREMISGTVKAE